MGAREKLQSHANLDGLVAQLRGYVAAREIGHGLSCLERHRKAIGALAPGQAHSARLLLLVAIWTDMGFSPSPPVKDLLSRFDPGSCSSLPLSDYICLRLAHGMTAMADESMDIAVTHIDFVLNLSRELGDSFLLAIANYWKGRCLRRRGEYDEALIYSGRGRDLALELGYPRMAAVMQVLESWLLFQQGNWKEALRISAAAETTLRTSDDYVTLGNIQSFLGRMARREGDLERAIGLFSGAIELYRRRDPNHPHLARTHANLALSKRGLGLQLQKRIDLEAQRRRKTSESIGNALSRRPPTAQVQSGLRLRMIELRREALEDLKAAREIYRLRPTHHGLGTVYINAAYIHLDAGDFHHAEREAVAAYELGQKKSDYILMGRARVQLCMIENAKLEEDIDGENDVHAQRALEYSKEAIELAKHTQHHYLLATAYLWQGLTQCNSNLDDVEAAQASYAQARAACNANKDDNIWKDLQALRARIVHRGDADHDLKAWSQGRIEGKTFHQVSEEFADLVITRVWEQEGRKVSRAARRLSISPKKVRLILARVGRRKHR